jgi:hypothetical protein
MYEHYRLLKIPYVYVPNYRVVSFCNKTTNRSRHAFASCMATFACAELLLAFLASSASSFEKLLTESKSAIPAA